MPKRGIAVIAAIIIDKNKLASAIKATATNFEGDELYFRTCFIFKMSYVAQKYKKHLMICFPTKRKRNKHG
jgi:hypothetical protein